MRDEKEERKKQARSNKQTRQSNTAHPMYMHVPGRHSDSLDSSLKDKRKESEQIQNNIAIISFSFSL